MRRAKVKSFLLQGCRFAIRDAAAQTFGWPTILSAALLGYVLTRLGIKAFQNPVESNVAVAGISLSLALFVNIFIASFKAYRVVKPFTVTVTDEVRSPDFAFNEKVRGFSAAVVVRNRSVAFLKDCVAYVMNVPSADGLCHPRFVEKFDLPPMSNKTIFIAYWFTREHPNLDDNDIGIPGPTSASFGGNVCRIPGPEALLDVKIKTEDIDDQEIRCRVWIDKESRRLRAAQHPSNSRQKMGQT